MKSSPLSQTRSTLRVRLWGDLRPGLHEGQATSHCGRPPLKCRRVSKSIIGCSAEFLLRGCRGYLWWRQRVGERDEFFVVVDHLYVEVLDQRDECFDVRLALVQVGAVQHGQHACLH